MKINILVSESRKNTGDKFKPAEWWERSNKKGQKDYVSKHPRSKYKGLYDDEDADEAIDLNDDKSSDYNIHDTHDINLYKHQKEVNLDDDEESGEDSDLDEKNVDEMEEEYDGDEDDGLEEDDLDDEIDDDIDDSEEEEVKKPKERYVEPDHHKAIVNWDAIESKPKQLTPFQSLRLSDEIRRNSPEVAVNGELEAPLPKTRDMVVDVKKALGNTLPSHESTIRDIATDIRKPPQDDDSVIEGDWDIDDNGKVVQNQEEEEKAVRKKKLMKFVSNLAIAAVAGIFLGPAAAALVGIIGLTLAEQYCKDLDDGKLKPLKVKPVATKIEPHYQEDVDDTRVIRTARPTARLEQDYEYYEDSQGNLKRKKKALIGKSRPISKENYNYRAGPTGIRRYTNQRYSTQVLSSNSLIDKTTQIKSETSIDEDLTLIVNSYKSWLKDQDLQSIIESIRKKHEKASV